MIYFTYVYTDQTNYIVVEHDDSIAPGWTRPMSQADAATYSVYQTWIQSNTPSQIAGNQYVTIDGQGNVTYNSAQAAADALAAAWVQVRAQRNTLITATDWSQMVDAPISSGDKTAMAQYRQQLRDLPQTTTDPTRVVYPSVPVMIKLSINNQSTGTITPVASAASAAQAAADSFTGSPQWGYLDEITSLIDQDTANVGLPVVATSTSGSPSISVTGGTTAFHIGWAVYFSGTTPAGFIAKNAYYVVGGTSSTVQLSATPGGSAISAMSTVSSGCNLNPCWVPPQFTPIIPATYSLWYPWSKLVLAAFVAYNNAPTTANLAALQAMLAQNPPMNL